MIFGAFSHFEAAFQKTSSEKVNICQPAKCTHKHAAMLSKPSATAKKRNVKKTRHNEPPALAMWVCVLKYPHLGRETKRETTSLGYTQTKGGASTLVVRLLSKVWRSSPRFGGFLRILGSQKCRLLKFRELPLPRYCWPPQGRCEQRTLTCLFIAEWVTIGKMII